MLTPEDFRVMLRVEVNRAGSQTAWAEKNGVSQAHVSDVIHGHRGPGKRLLQAFKLKRVVRYVDAG